MGYAFGVRVGKKLFSREDSLLFHKKNVLKAQEFYRKHGAKTIVIARFMPVVRTFAPIVAGIGTMQYSTFIKYNLVGGLLWAIGLNISGFFLGRLIPDVDRYIVPIVLLIVIASIAPSVWHLLKDPDHRAEIGKLLRRFIKK